MDINFVLTQDLVIPSRGDLQGAYFLFRAGEHGLTYFVVPNARNRTIQISLQVYAASTGDLIFDLGAWNITEDGFPVQAGEETVFINRYDDVIGYFNGDGSLTTEGIEWAKATPFMGRTVGFFIT